MRTVSALLLVALVALVAPVAAAADLVRVDNGKSGAGGAEVVLNAGSPGSGGSSTGSGAGQTDKGRSSVTRTCTYKGEEIPCTSFRGVWSAERECYVRRSSTPVTPESPYQGHTDGVVYECHTFESQGGGRFGVGPGRVFYFWGPAAGAGAPQLVDPVTLAEEAVERMQLIAPRIGMTPLDASSPALVGANTWLWVADADPRSYGPIARSASAGSTTVSARASVRKVVWDMGDGSRITCRNPGTPWTPAAGSGASPTCGHRYETSSAGAEGGTFVVRAVAHWRVDWQGAGQAGHLDFTLTRSRDVEVTELHVLQAR